MDGLCSTTFAYAEDVIILFPTGSALKRLIVICYHYGVAYNLAFSPVKWALIIFSHAENDIKDVTGSIFGRNIRSVSNEKHLGHFLSFYCYKRCGKRH